MFDKLKTALEEPYKAYRYLNRNYYRRGDRQCYNTNGIDIFEEDWDNLIILDACRYDIFEEMNTIPGTLTKKTSRGGMTLEFLRGNFQNRDLTDVVYVTANPMLYRYASEIRADIHQVLNVWRDDGWDETANTVLPETLTARAIKAESTYPNKRLVIHYIQPHFPFIGSDIGSNVPDPDVTDTDIWTELMRGEIELSKAEIWDAYETNLMLALESVEELIDQLSGKSVITSDHGNLFGERAWPVPNQEWGHPMGIYVPKLVEVPWLTVPSKNRKSVDAEVSVETDDVDDGTVKDRLKSLGYT